MIIHDISGGTNELRTLTFGGMIENVFMPKKARSHP